MQTRFNLVRMEASSGAWVMPAPLPTATTQVQRVLKSVSGAAVLGAAVNIDSALTQGNAALITFDGTGPGICKVAIGLNGVNPAAPTSPATADATGIVVSPTAGGHYMFVCDDRPSDYIHRVAIYTTTNSGTIYVAFLAL